MHLDLQQPNELQTYLTRKGWIDTDEAIVSLEIPGEGNMNYTLRAQTAQRSVIVKQARPYVEKYPAIAAPVARAVVEGQFYQRIACNPELGTCMPQLLGVDPDESLLILEDLGMSSDYTYLYQGSQAGPAHLLTEAEIQGLIRFLSTLHNEFWTERPDPAFANVAMRTLNAEHIFTYPFLVDNGFDLDTVQPGLQAVAIPYKQHDGLKRAIADLTKWYTGIQAKHVTLLHGDYYPGSWLRTEKGTRVIDPEFCFYGPAEFDLGVMLAHLHMARQPDSVIQQVLTQYDRPALFNEQLLRQFTGIEIMRRLIGLAQLPLSLSLSEKETLLSHARQLLLG